MDTEQFNMGRLLPVNPDYECVLAHPPPKRKILRSKKYTATVEGAWVEGFTLDKRGRTRRNGIRFLLQRDFPL